jgi:hypothetical protein
LAVDGPFRTGPMDAAFNGALYDAGGLEIQGNSGWMMLPNTVEDNASSFYSSRISSSLPWISSIAGSAVNSLASENFSAWQSLYFSPAEIASPQMSGPLADFDSDGISNLLEFAFHLDPIFNERVTMISETGLRGLPLIRKEMVSGEEKLSIEFVRRTTSSGAGLTYMHQFSSDLTTWQTVGVETVTAINPRWERVKVVDSVAVSGTPKRFGRVRVVLSD